MKLFLIHFLIFTSVLSVAQKITTNEAEFQFNIAARNAVNTTIYQGDTADVIKEWKKYLKLNKCEEIFLQKAEVKGHNVFLKEISNKPIDIYTKFEENKEDKTIKMYTAVDLGAGNYIASKVNPVEIKALEKVVRSFALNMTKAPIEAYLKGALDFQEKLKKEIDLIEKGKNKLGQDSIKYLGKISKTEKEIEIKNTEISKKMQEIANQKKSNDTITDLNSERAKAANKIYNKLLKEQKSIENDVLDLKNDIIEYREKYTNTLKEIKTDSLTQVKKKEEIESQKKIAENLKAKLKEIS